MTKCCGNAVVVSGNNQQCKGKKNDTCVFTITQRICVEVPVIFGATATAGDTFVDCLAASAEDICTNCSDEEAL